MLKTKYISLMKGKKAIVQILLFLSMFLCGEIWFEVRSAIFYGFVGLFYWALNSYPRCSAIKRACLSRVEFCCQLDSVSVWAAVSFGGVGSVNDS